MAFCDGGVGLQSALEARRRSFSVARSSVRLYTMVVVVVGEFLATTMAPYAAVSRRDLPRRDILTVARSGRHAPSFEDQSATGLTHGAIND